MHFDFRFVLVRIHRLVERVMAMAHGKVSEGFEDLIAKVEKYEKSGDKKTAQQVYENELFPLIKKRFVEQASEVLSGKKYSYLVLTTGKTPEPLILSINAFRPKKVYFIYTEGSEETMIKVIDACNLHVSKVEKKQVRQEDATDVYRAVFEIVREIGGVKDLAVDITGGTKAMVGGCCIAAALLKMDIFYVNSEFGWLLGKSRPGTEKLVKLRNPYDVFGHVEIEIGKELFKSHIYTGAKAIFNRLAEGGVEEGKTRTYLFLCHAFECWDRFQYEEAKTNLDKALGRLENLEVLPEAKIKDLKNLRDTLNVLKDNHKKDLKDNLRNEEFTASLITDIFENAERRAQQGRYDDGIIRLYRILELIAQSRLIREHGVDPSSCRNIIPAVSENFEAITKDLYGNPKRLPEKLGLMDSWALLYAFGDDSLIKNYKELEGFKNKVQKRNLLMVEHRNEWGDRADYGEYKEYVLPFIRKVVPDFEERRKGHGFIKIS